MANKILIVLSLCFGCLFLSLEGIQTIEVQKKIKEYLQNQEYQNPTDLCEIMNHYGSDKGNGWHNYTTLYAKLFAEWINEELNIFELGLGTNYTDIPSNMGANGKPGASLFGWVAYFQNARVFGADIDERILFNTDTISTFYCDQRDPICILQMLDSDELQNIKFDIIIDDGLHEYNANLTFLINMIERLKDGGIYIVEDLQLSTKNSFKKILPYLQDKYGLEYIEIVSIPNRRNMSDNCLLVIQK